MALIRALLTLAVARDDDFAALVPGDLADAETLAHVRRIAAKLRSQNEDGAWLMMSDGSPVGLIGYHAPPNSDGFVEIGYNVAPARQKRGFATAAVARLLDVARADARIAAVFAETDASNVASQIVLQRNEFRQIARFASDDPSGEAIRWRRDLR